MEKFISEVQQVQGDVRGAILNQLVDCCASGNAILLSTNEQFFDKIHYLTSFCVFRKITSSKSSPIKGFVAINLNISKFLLP